LEDEMNISDAASAESGFKKWSREHPQDSKDSHQPGGAKPAVIPAAAPLPAPKVPGQS
jgi:hypothetical protein